MRLRKKGTDLPPSPKGFGGQREIRQVLLWDSAPQQQSFFVASPGLPSTCHARRDLLRINFSPCLVKKGTDLEIRASLWLLLRQGSNLDSSDSESDVLPVTPRSNLGLQIYDTKFCLAN